MPENNSIYPMASLGALTKNKMVNSSNGPAAKLPTSSLSYLSIVRMYQTGQYIVPQYHVVTLITVKDLNNDDLDGYYGSVQFGYRWSQVGAAGHTWSLSKSSTTLTLMVIALGNLVTDGHNWSQVITFVTRSSLLVSIS